MQETLPHAVQRMRSQGYNDHQIAGQIHQWHSGWSPAQIASVLRPQPQGVTVAQKTYHATSTKPFFPGQKPDHFQIAGRGGGIPIYKQGFGSPGPNGSQALGTILGAPAAHTSEEQSQRALARVYKQNHPLGQQLIQGVANAVPGVALAKGIRDSNVNFGTVGTEAFNDVTSGLFPMGKAAALFGGLRGLRRARETATALEDAGKVAKVAEPAKAAVAAEKPAQSLKAMQAEYANLETNYNTFVDSFASKAKLTPEERKAQLEINTRRGKFKKQQSGKTASGRASGASGHKVQSLPKTLREESRAQMEQELVRLARANPEHSGAKAFLAASDRMDELRHLIGQHEESALFAAPAAEHVDVPAAPAADPFEHPAPPAPSVTPKIAVPAAQMPDEAAQLRAVLSGKAAKDALKGMGQFEKIGAKTDPYFGMSAKRAYKAEAELRTQERSIRLRNANEHLGNTALEPSERIRLWKEEMKGELPKIHWRGFEELDADTVKAMTRYALDEAPNLLGTQRVRVVTALENAVNGIVPRPHELKLLELVFGKDVTRGFAKLAEHPLRDAIVGGLNIPRTLMASMDFSAPLRQGLVIGTRHPIVTGKNFASMFKSFGSEKFFQALGNEIKSRPTFPLMLEAKLPLTSLDRGVGESEEAFAGINVAEKFTGGKRFSPVRMSDRAYTAFLDKTRADVFDLLIRQAHSQGNDIQNEKFLHDLGRFIGNATGRGTFDHEALERAMPLLNIGLFSPRLIASRMQLLNPIYYARLDPFVRRQALTAALSTFGAISTVLGLAAAAGAKVGTDWRSADFGKIRIGNTRIDIAGGFQQYFHLLGEMVTGQRINSTTGVVTSLRHPSFGQQSTWDALVNFGRGKLAPLPSIGADWLTGESGVGQKFSTMAELKSHFIPLIGQDAKDLYNHPFHGMNGIEAALAGYGLEMFGTGLQTYEQQPAKSTGGTSDPFESSGGSGSDPFETP